jgi:saccharopine dehydrogenase-like NADP-dependent oxidoreductase
VKEGKILIVGGYGAVGQVITKRLANLFPAKVIVAGRNFQKAEEFSNELDGNITPMKLDILSIPDNDRRLDKIDLVIMCIDQTQTKFVFQCVKRGIHYIDITANYNFLSKIEKLNNEAKTNNSTVVLSVGLAPGITNLLAKQCKYMVKNIQYADIYIMLGLGEAHGEAAYRWAFEDLNDTFFIKENGKKRQVKSFRDGKQSIFPEGIGKRTAYRSNFSDQHVIPKTLNIDSVSTRICFDSSVMTWVYALLRKTGLSKLVKFRIAQNFLMKTLKLITLGSDQFVLKIEAGANQEDGLFYECSISGNGQGKNTGLVAAKVAEKLYTSSFASGVFQIEQLFDPLVFFDSLSANLKFEESILVDNKKVLTNA